MSALDDVGDSFWPLAMAQIHPDADIENVVVVVASDEEDSDKDTDTDSDDANDDTKDKDEDKDAAVGCVESVAVNEL